MSSNDIYKYQNGAFPDLSSQDFSKLIPAGSYYTALFDELKNKLNQYTGLVEVRIDTDSIKYKTKGESWKELISLKPESPPPDIPVLLHLPKDSYKLQFKADEQSKANRTEPFVYNVTINHAKYEDVDRDNLIPEKISLCGEAKTLAFNCSSIKLTESESFSKALNFLSKSASCESSSTSCKASA